MSGVHMVQAQPVPVPLLTLDSDQVLAGIPRATITIALPEQAPSGPGDADEVGIDDPIVFVGLGRSRLSYVHYCHEYADGNEPAPTIFCSPVEMTAGDASTPPNLELIDDQTTPIRGFGTHTIELGGIGERLAAGEQIHLMVYGYHPLYAISGSRQPAALPLQIGGSVSLPLLADRPALTVP